MEGRTYCTPRSLAVREFPPAGCAEGWVEGLIEEEEGRDMRFVGAVDIVGSGGRNQETVEEWGQGGILAM